MCNGENDIRLHLLISTDTDDPPSDIPLPLVTSGCENSGNLRELALNRMKDFGAECRDVRFREVGVRHPTTASATRHVLIISPLPHRPT